MRECHLETGPRARSAQLQLEPREFEMSKTVTRMRSNMRLGVIGLLTLGPLLIFPAASEAQQSPATAEQIAKTYGLDSFGQIESIRYTWSLETPAIKISRSWEWSPKTDTVSYEGKDKEGKPVKASYQRAQLASQSDAIKNDIDPAFANDQYWLLLPFHVVWDGATATDEGQQKLPLGDGSADRVVFKYPSEGGYQPGDTWDFYIGADKRIQAIVYHRGGPQPPHLVVATYTDYKKAGPLLIAMEHRGTADGNPLHLWISDVSVKVTGSDNWINAQ
jgi:hypothetical protein